MVRVVDKSLCSGKVTPIGGIHREFQSYYHLCEWHRIDWPFAVQCKNDVPKGVPQPMRQRLDISRRFTRLRAQQSQAGQLDSQLWVSETRSAKRALRCGSIRSVVHRFPCSSRRWSVLLRRGAFDGVPRSVPNRSRVRVRPREPAGSH